MNESAELVSGPQAVADKLSRTNAGAVTEKQALEFFDGLEDGQTVSQAAKAAGIHKRTAYRVLQRYEAKLDAAKNLLSAKALQAAEDWVKASAIAAKRGQHTAAKELLQTIGAVDVLGSNQGGPSVIINIGTPDRPIALSAGILDVSPPKTSE